MVGKQLCRHGVEVHECSMCRSKKRSCMQCGRIRYAPYAVRIPIHLVELRTNSELLVGVRSFNKGWSTYVTSMAPLCRECWHYSTPEQRLSYFRALWLESKPGPQHLDEWFAIESAVLSTA